MRKIIEHYYCDYCDEEIGKVPHISIHIAQYAGWVKPPKWKHKKQLENRPFHFCDEKHLGAFLKTNAKKRGRPKKK